ncbi:MAG: hypothetical protein KDB61_07865 [Planctomycetes bacterium]|nr:hypothetical protein [Planctomycetota bacterium]
MKPTRLLFVGFLCAYPCFLSFDPAGDGLTFAPGEGTQLTKTFTLEQEISDGEMSVSMGSKAWSIEVQGETSRSIRITDSYGSMEGSRPTLLRRRFTDGVATIDAQSTFTSGEQSEEFQAQGEGTSRWNDLTVIFTWDGEEEAYAKAFDEDSEGEHAWLETLEEDMDLRGFLPEGPVDTQDEWNADPAVLLSFLAPGGNLQWDLPLDDQDGPNGLDPAIYSELRPMLADADIEGDIVCTYAGPRETERGEFLAIEIRVDVEAFTDLTDKAQEEYDSDELPDGMGYEIGEMAMEFHLEGKGTLLWDGKAGHLHAFEFEGETELIVARVVSITGHPQVIENAIRMDVPGSVRVKVNTGE